MQNAALPAVVPKFIDQVVERYARPGRTLTINHLRLGVRDERMTEIREWSNDDLDIVEVHAARFDADAPLTAAMTVPAGADLPPLSASSICAPSPVAWM